MNASILRKLAIALLMALMLGGIAACEDEGPAEQAGENIDNAMDDAGDSIEEMGDSVEESADDAQN